MPQISIDVTLCDGCGNCVSCCPMGDVLKVDDHKCIVVKVDDCMACQLCETECPKSAIVVAR